MTASDDLVQRLRSQHHDLKQGAYYTPSEDAAWDATAEAADEIVRLQQALRDLLEAWTTLQDAEFDYQGVAANRALDDALAAAHAVLNGDQQ